MPYRLIPLATGEVYHVYNRGVEKRNIFLTNRDHRRCLETILYYQQKGSTISFSKQHRGFLEEINNLQNDKLVEIICYTLMPNHIHLILKQIEDNGISIFMSKFADSYAKYFNTKHKRVGPLFQGQFKAKLIESDEQLVHTNRYIVLNPLVAKICKSLEDYPWS